VRHFVYDSQGRVVAEYGASASEVKAEFIWALPPAANDNSPFGGDDGIVGYAPLALVAENGLNQLEIYWVHGNHLGVPIVTSNALGQVVDPGNDFLRPGFPGQSQVLSDLYYNRARDYDPVLGRFIQADPIGLLGDVNPYLYAAADPVNMIDPFGLKTLWEHYTGLPDSYRRNAINAIAGVSDAATFGATYWVRERLGSNRDVRICDDFYEGGEWASLLLGGGRLLYAGAAKVGARLAPNGQAANLFRNDLKWVFRGGLFRNFRRYPYQRSLDKYGSDAAVKAAAGRTNGPLNAVGGVSFAGGGVAIGDNR
jgi:RHS repeat-associated protein